MAVDPPGTNAARVYVLPITHAAPTRDTKAMEIPASVCRSAGLDAARAWMVLSEFNEFVWPGFDLAIVPGRTQRTVAYGFLTPGFFARLRERWLTLDALRRSRRVPRDTWHSGAGHLARSGGQRQRVAIARAFLKDAPLLVLDEATSHLDTISEAQVRAALDALMEDRTTIVAAHRLSTIRAADLILVLQAGRVIEAGRHAELLAWRRVYARLVEHQMAGVADERVRAG